MLAPTAPQDPGAGMMLPRARIGPNYTLTFDSCLGHGILGLFVPILHTHMPLLAGGSTLSPVQLFCC